MKMVSGARALDKIYKRRDRYEIPDWQRQEVWGRSKKQSLIDSILMGWKLPKFYLLKTNEQPEEYEVVDGQQRLTAIFEFFDNDLPLSPASEDNFKAKYYKELSDTLSDYFDDFEIEFDLIEDATDEEVKEFFQRLQEGLPLTSAEKLNSIHSKLRDFCFDLSKHNFFKEKVSVSDKRYGHFDIAAKVSCIEVDGIDVGLRFDDMQAVFNSQANFSINSETAKRIIESLDFLDKAIPNKSALLRNRSVVQSIITLTARLVSSGKHHNLAEMFGAFLSNFLMELATQVERGKKATDQDYLEFQRTISANLRTGPRTRHNILLRNLLCFKPEFSFAFAPSEITETGLHSQIKKEGSKIIDYIAKINKSYSSKHGEDLFKATNKTATAQSLLSSDIINFNDYKVFIENCYFLFYESLGNRIGDAKPEVFQDINVLRTSLQHDIDHGKQNKVRSKNIKIGRTIKKYSGLTSIENAPEEVFPVIQINMLTRLSKELDTLNKNYMA